MVGAAKRPSGERIRGGLSVAGLFAGVGGLELGLERAGCHTALLCENDPEADAVLAARFPRAARHRDVRDLRAKDLGDVDVLTAGFPCQDLSQAGATAGIVGEKSSLVGEVFRLLRRQRVPWVVLENVPFMLHLDRGRAMHRIVDELEGLGYRWAYRVVDAMAFGLPQRRRRVFVVASRTEDPCQVLFADDATARGDGAWHRDKPVGFYWTEGNRGVGWAVGAVPTLKGGSGLGIPSAPAVLLPSGEVVTPSIEGAEKLQGFPSGWTEAVESVSRGRYRWRMVGNAVNVRASQWLGSRLRKPGVFDERRVGEELGASSSWPAAARGRDGAREAVSIGEWPERRPLEPIAKFLVGAKPLSVRATDGFVSRARRAEREGHLSFPDGFLDGLDAHLERMRELAARAVS